MIFYLAWVFRKKCNHYIAPILRNVRWYSSRMGSCSLLLLCPVDHMINLLLILLVVRFCLGLGFLIFEGETQDSGLQRVQIRLLLFKNHNRLLLCAFAMKLETPTSFIVGQAIWEYCDEEALQQPSALSSLNP